MGTERVEPSSESSKKQKIEADKREKQRVEHVREVDPEEQNRMRKKFRSRMEGEEEPCGEQPSPLDMISRFQSVPGLGSAERSQASAPWPPASSSLPPQSDEENQGLPSDPDFWRDVEFSTPNSQQQTQQTQQQQQEPERDKEKEKKKPLTAEEAKKHKEEEKGSLPTAVFMKENRKKAKFPGLSKEQQKLIPAQMKPKKKDKIPEYPNLQRKKGKPKDVTLAGQKKKEIETEPDPFKMLEQKMEKEKSPLPTPFKTKKTKREKKTTILPFTTAEIEKSKEKEAPAKKEKGKKVGLPFPKGTEEERPGEMIRLKEKKAKKAAPPRKGEKTAEALPLQTKEKEESLKHRKEKKKGFKEKETAEIVPITASAPHEEGTKREKQKDLKRVPFSPSIQDFPAPVKAASAEMTESAKSCLRTAEIRDLFRQMVGTIVYMSTPKGDSKTQILLNADNFKSPLFHGMTITIERFSTNPYSFNIRLSGSPQAINVVNDNIEGLRSAFERSKERFHVARLDTSYSTKRPLFHRKEKAAKEGGMGEAGEEK